MSGCSVLSGHTVAGLPLLLLLITDTLASSAMLIYLTLWSPGMWCVCCAAVLCVHGSISPGLAGLCLVYALDLTRYLKHGTAMASKTESDFNSVERVVQYLTPATGTCDWTTTRAVATDL
jgi:hypothetical protein